MMKIISGIIDNENNHSCSPIVLSQLTRLEFVAWPSCRAVDQVTSGNQELMIQMLDLLIMSECWKMFLRTLMWNAMNSDPRKAFWMRDETSSTN